MARVAHSGMTADEVTENIEAAVRTVATKLGMKGPMMKVIHLKSQTSVALPIYTSDLSHLSVLDSARNKKASGKKKAKDGKTEDGKKTKPVVETKEEDEDEDIPELVPIQSPSKKTKLEKPPRKKPMQKTTRAAAGKKISKSPSKATRKAGKTVLKGRRKLPGK